MLKNDLSIKLKKSVYLVLYTIILIFLIFILVRLIQENKKLKNYIPHLIEGESIKYFDLISVDGERINSSVLKSNKPLFIFLFSRPCSPCNVNIVFWNEMVKIMKDKVKTFGIILSGHNKAFNFSKSKKTQFKIFVPANLDIFIKKMRIKSNFAQTILYYNNKIKIIRVGNIDGDTFTEILRKTKKMIKIIK